MRSPLLRVVHTPATPVAIRVPFVSVARVSKSYGARVALDGVSFEIPRGETLGLLGPNGAGKTTLLHLIAGVTSADAGCVTIFPDSARSIANPRARIGLAPQSLAVYRELTAEENLGFFGRLHGLRGKALGERVTAALELVGLAARRRHRVSTLSGGMQRRLNLACALVHEPELLLLDEPTVGVDAQSRARIFACLEELKASGLTLVYSTHYLEEAERLCDRVAIFDGGRIVALDALCRLLRQSADLEALLLGLTVRSGD
jgi:ABC-2 type transport system ATP-binding protein